ncbi:hypothetical protein PFISCL1PPCAC_14823, partial [Pristionchus fissidentatus]
AAPFRAHNGKGSVPVWQPEDTFDTTGGRNSLESSRSTASSRTKSNDRKLHWMNAPSSQELSNNHAADDNYVDHSRAIPEGSNSHSQDNSSEIMAQEGGSSILTVFQQIYTPGRQINEKCGRSPDFTVPVESRRSYAGRARSKSTTRGIPKDDRKNEEKTDKWKPKDERQSRKSEPPPDKLEIDFEKFVAERKIPKTIDSFPIAATLVESTVDDTVDGGTRISSGGMDWGKDTLEDEEQQMAKFGLPNKFGSGPCKMETGKRVREDIACSPPQMVSWYRLPPANPLASPSLPPLVINIVPVKKRLNWKGGVQPKKEEKVETAENDDTHDQSHKCENEEKIDGEDTTETQLPPHFQSRMDKTSDGGCCEDDVFSPMSSPPGRGQGFPPHSASYIDSHCHLDFIFDKMKYFEFSELRSKFPSAFPPTFKGCVANFIKPAIYNKYMPWIANIAMDEAVLGTSWGVHPHYSDQVGTEELNELKKLIITRREELKIVAVGECGIDQSNKNCIPLARQLAAFKWQVATAVELDLPIIIHCREGVKGDPEDMILDVLKQHPNHPIHRHCFTRDNVVAEKWMRTLHNVTFGFTPAICKNNWASTKAIEVIPLDRIHLETDAPYFKPQMFKDMYTNDFSLPPAAVAVAARIAEVKGESIDEVIRVTAMCTSRIYRLPRRSSSY